jgi:hypothetical protein
MQFIGTLYGGKSVAQVALNYLVSKGKPFALSFVSCAQKHELGNRPSLLWNRMEWVALPQNQHRCLADL